MAEPGKVAVKTPDGKVGYVPEAEVASLPPGWTAASEAEVEREKRLAAAETAGQQVIATGEAAARGVTLGLSDVALRSALGDEYSASAEARQQANPMLTGVTEAGAGIGAVLASGGSGLAARGLALSPAALAARAGAAAGRFAGSTAARAGTGLGARIASRVAAMGTEGAVEGAIIGAGQAASQASLGREDLAAEQLWAGAVGGALIGGGAGSALGLVGGLGSAAAAGAGRGVAAGRRLIGDRLPQLTGKVDDLAASGTIRKQAKTLADESTLKIFGYGEDISKLGSEAKVAQIGEDVRNFTLSDGRKLVDFGDSAESIYPKIQVAKREANNRLGAVREEIRQAGAPATKFARDWLEDVDRGVLNELKTSPSPSLRSRAKKVEKEIKWIRDVAENAEASKRMADDLLARSEVSLAGLRQSGSAGIRDAAQGIEGAIASLRDKSASYMFRRADIDSLISELKKVKSSPSSIARNEASTLLKEAQALKTQFTDPVTYDDLLKQQKALKKTIYPKSPKGGGLRVAPDNAEELMKVERSLEGHMEAYAENTFAQVAPERVGEYAQARRIAESLNKANDMAKRTSTRALKNRAISPSDYGIGAAGGLLVGGPAGLVAGAASAVAHKFVREHGRSVVALMADRIAKGNALMDQSLSAYFKKALAPAEKTTKALARQGRRGAPGRSRRAAYPVAISAFGIEPSARRARVENRIRDIQEIQSNPTLAMDRLQERLQGLDRGADSEAGRQELARVKTQLVTTAMRGMRAVSSRLPSQVVAGGIQPQFDKITLSQVEVDRLARIMHAVDKPLSVLDDLQNGTLDRDAVEVVQEVYPSLFQEMRFRAMEHIAEANQRGKAIPYHARVQLGNLFGFTAVPTMDPGFMSRHQERAGAVEQEAAQQMTAPSARKVPKFATGQTTAQRMETM